MLLSYLRFCRALRSSTLMLDSVFLGLLTRFTTLERHSLDSVSDRFLQADSVAVMISTTGTSVSATEKKKKKKKKKKTRASTHSSGSLRIRWEQFLAHLEMHSEAISLSNFRFFFNFFFFLIFKIQFSSPLVGVVLIFRAH